MVFGGMPEREGKGMRCDAYEAGSDEGGEEPKREAESMPWTRGPADDGVVQVHRVPVAAHRRVRRHVVLREPPPVRAHRVAHLQRRRR
jgi:hypothetical protein